MAGQGLDGHPAKRLGSVAEMAGDGQPAPALQGGGGQELVLVQDLERTGQLHRPPGDGADRGQATFVGRGHGPMLA